jgi:hypothetical protein
MIKKCIDKYYIIKRLDDSRAMAFHDHSTQCWRC